MGPYFAHNACLPGLPLQYSQWHIVLDLGHEGVIPGGGEPQGGQHNCQREWRGCDGVPVTQGLVLETPRTL